MRLPPLLPALVQLAAPLAPAWSSTSVSVQEGREMTPLKRRPERVKAIETFIERRKRALQEQR